MRTSGGARLSVFTNNAWAVVARMDSDLELMILDEESQLKSRAMGIRVIVARV